MWGLNLKVRGLNLKVHELKLNVCRLIVLLRGLLLRPGDMEKGSGLAVLFAVCERDDKNSAENDSDTILIEL